MGEYIPRLGKMRGYSKAGPLGSRHRRCVIDYDEVFSLLNVDESKLATAPPKYQLIDRRETSILRADFEFR